MLALLAKADLHTPPPRPDGPFFPGLPPRHRLCILLVSAGRLLPLLPIFVLEPTYAFHQVSYTGNIHMMDYLCLPGNPIKQIMALVPHSQPQEPLLVGCD